MVVCETDVPNMAARTAYYESCETPRHDPPPYPAHLTNLYQPGFRQSYSGSEASTDMSLSSTENLSTSARQDPQGEETSTIASSPGPRETANTDASFGVLPPYCPGPGVEAKATDSGNFYVTGNHNSICSHQEVLLGGRCTGIGVGACTTCSPLTSCNDCHVTASSANIKYMNLPDYIVTSFTSPTCVTTNKPIMVPNKHTDFTADYKPLNQDIKNIRTTAEDTRTTPASSVHYRVATPSPPALATPTNNATKSGLKSPPPLPLPPTSTAIDMKKRRAELMLPTHSPMSQSHSYPPPPQYPGRSPTIQGAETKKEMARSFDFCDLNLEPDLTRLTAPELKQWVRSAGGSGSNDNVQSAQPKCSPPKKLELDHAVIAARATEMVEKLSEENCSLRQQLDNYLSKVSKLQKFELEIDKVREAYEGLVKRSQKREHLEKAMRYKLDAEVHKLTEMNKELKDQLDKALRQYEHNKIYNEVDTDIKLQLGQKDSMIAKLLSQNKEAMTTKERLEIEVAAQRATLQEQRAHIAVLDNALANAHTNILRTEEELHRRQMQDAKIEELEHAVAQLQRTSEQREAIEERLRSRLEEQLRALRAEKSGVILDQCDTDEGISSDTESPSSTQGLIQQMHDKEQQILLLKSEVLKWEQRYLEESALRQLAVDAASMPKDVRIAALEQSSVETERIIAEARSDRLKHLEEVYQANRKAAELESKVKTLQAQLAEKDAMIGVLQRHSSLSRCSSISSVLSGGSSSPMHSARPSLMTTPSASPASSRNSSMSTPSPPPPRSSPSLNHISSSLSTSSRQGRNGLADHSSIYNVMRDDADAHLHTKSSSTYSVPSEASNSSSSSSSSSSASSSASSSPSSLSPSSSMSTPNTNSQVRLLQQKLAAQAALFRSLTNGTEQLTKCLWQV